MANGTTSYTYSYVASIPGPWAATYTGPGFVVRSDLPNQYITCASGDANYEAFLAWVNAGNPAPAGWTGPKS